MIIFFKKVCISLFYCSIIVQFFSLNFKWFSIYNNSMQTSLRIMRNNDLRHEELATDSRNLKKRWKWKKVELKFKLLSQFILYMIVRYLVYLALYSRNLCYIISYKISFIMSSQFINDNNQTSICRFPSGVPILCRSFNCINRLYLNKLMTPAPHLRTFNWKNIGFAKG
jgi:hypothetical protein